MTRCRGPELSLIFQVKIAKDIPANYQHRYNADAAQYHSTITSDFNGPLDLLAELNYDDTRSDAPIAVVMHGYSPATGNFGAVRANAQKLRDNGFFVISVAMRGRDGSDGIRDSGGVEIHDIYDAVEAVKADARFAGLTDGTNVHITGYSGGGGNTMSALTKFPDYFRVGAAFFGMSDYGFNPTDGWYNHGAGSRTSQLDTDVGNPNTGGATVLDKYLARASNLASKNNPYSEIHLFVNATETICPPVNSTSYRANAVAAESAPGEFGNITVHIGGPGIYEDFNGNSVNEANEEQDWLHTNPDANRQDAGELWYRDRLLAGNIPQPVLKASDEMRVAGYVKTTRFGLWLGDGGNAAGDLFYSIAGNLMRFSLDVISNDRNANGKLTVDTSAMAGREVSVELDDVVIRSFSGGGDFLYEGFGHGETLELIESGPDTNAPPTLGGFPAPIATTSQGSRTEVTFAALSTIGDEADSDGSVSGFQVREVQNGTLELGKDAASATPFSPGSNDTISASVNAYWRPASTGATVEAFTAVAKDDDLAVSGTATPATVEVTGGGLICYLDFENDTLDSSSSGNDGTNNGVSYSEDVPAALGNSLSSGGFDGNDSHVDLAYLGLFEKARAGGVTVSLWVKGASPASGGRWIVAEGNDTSGSTAYVWGTTSPAGKLTNFPRNDSGTGGSKTGDKIVFDDTWHHLAFTDDAGSVAVYVDGVAETGDFNYTPTGAYTFQNTSIGAWIRGGVPSPTISNDFVGLIDDVAIFGRVLEAGEIAALASGESPLASSNDFSTWIAGFPVGDDTALDDDPDHDGVKNGIENYFGTSPDIFSSGLVAEAADPANGTFIFIHPLNDEPADDLEVAYKWSNDLSTFTDDGFSFEGTTVSFAQGTPVGGSVTITATVTGKPLEKLFVNLEVRSKD